MAAARPRCTFREASATKRSQPLSRMSKASIRIFAAALRRHSLAAPAARRKGRGWTDHGRRGAQICAQILGADDYCIFPLPNFGLRREGSADALRGAGRQLRVRRPWPGQRVQFRPRARFSKRDEDDVGAPVGDVDLTIEAGGFVQAFSREFPDPRRAPPSAWRP